MEGMMLGLLVLERAGVGFRSRRSRRSTEEPPSLVLVASLLVMLLALVEPSEQFDNSSTYRIN